MHHVSEVGVATPKFSGGWTPLSKFLNRPLKNPANDYSTVLHAIKLGIIIFVLPPPPRNTQAPRTPVHHVRSNCAFKMCVQMHSNSAFKLCVQNVRSNAFKLCVQTVRSNCAFKLRSNAFKLGVQTAFKTCVQMHSNCAFKLCVQTAFKLCVQNVRSNAFKLCVQTVRSKCAFKVCIQTVHSNCAFCRVQVEIMGKRPKGNSGLKCMHSMLAIPVLLCKDSRVSWWLKVFRRDSYATHRNSTGGCAVCLLSLVCLLCFQRCIP